MRITIKPTSKKPRIRTALVVASSNIDRVGIYVKVMTHNVWSNRRYNY